MAASRSPPWADLPSELLGLVLLRTPCHGDRVRLRAVCRPWRCNARLQPLPLALPWVALPDGTFVGLPDGAVHRVSVPDEDVSQRLSAGSMLFLVHRGDNTCSLMNPCSASAAMTPLPELAFCFPDENEAGSCPRAPEFIKLVTSDRLVAALTKYKRVAVSARRPPNGASKSCPTMTMTWTGGAVDIAFFQGKLYVLTVEEELHAVDFSNKDELKSVQCICNIPVEIDYSYHYNMPQRWYNPYSTEYYTHWLYLVASGDRLLLVKRKIYTPPLMPFDEPKIYRTDSFEVFQAAGLSSGSGWWSKVDTLMGHALFVGKGCCKSLPPVVDAQYATGARHDSIYFINQRTACPKEDDTSWKKMYENPFLDSGVYNIRDHTMMPLPLETTVVPHEGPWRPGWLFPSDT